ncbi:MAG: tetratricopeptide repeat protein [Patescibacteria group bacterium]
MVLQISKIASKSWLVPLVVLFTIGILLFAKSIPYEFVWDDEEQIVNNTVIHHISNAPQFFSGSTFNTGGSGSLSGVYYRPIMLFYFSNIYSLFGASPSVYHFIQILLHIIVSFCVYLLIRKLLVQESMKEISLKKLKYIDLLSLAASVIYLISPLNVESVVYISAVQDVIYTLFGLLSLLFLLSKSKNNAKKIAFASIFLSLSLLTKESGVIFVGLYLIFGFLFDEKRKVLHAFTSIFIFSFYLFIRFFLIHVPFGKYDISPIAHLTNLERLFTIPKVIFYYISNFLIPRDLSVMQHWVVTNFSSAEFYLPLILVISLSIGLVWANIKYKKSSLFFFSVWSILALGLHSQIFALDMTVASRWSYTVLIGFVGIIAASLSHFDNSKITKYGRALFIFYFFTYFLLSFFRLDAWQNGYILYETDMKKNPNSFDLNNNFGVELFRNGAREEALTYFEKSIELEPKWAFPWNNAGAVYEYQGDLEKAKKYYQKSIDIGDYYLAYENLAGILIKEKKYGQAKVFIAKALQKLPMNERLNYLYLELNKVTNDDQGVR